MLQYIVGHTLSGCPDDLTETRIAENVFHRAAYHPSEDNLVRVSARQLRAKLAEYYAGEGSGEDIVCDIPKGGYLATFRTRAETHIELIESGNVSLLNSQPQVQPRSWLAPLLAAGMLCLLIPLLQLYSENRQLRAHIASSEPPQTLFAPILPTAQQRTHIVVTDSALVLLDHLKHQTSSLESYASYRYLQLVPGDTQHGAQADFFRSLFTRQISSLADLRIVSSIFKSYPQRAREISIHHARNLHARDFDNDDDFLLIGSQRSNPWAALFESSLNFRFQPEYGASCLQNVHPQPGEQNLYCSANPGDEEGTDYARIAMVQNGSRKGNVALVAGISMEGTEAAGEFFMNPNSVPQVLKWLDVQRLSELSNYEILLKTYAVGGSGRSAKIVAVRKY